MRENRRHNGLDDPVFRVRLERGIVQPVDQPLQKVAAVFGGRATVTHDPDGVASDRAGLHLRCGFELVQDLGVEGADAIDGQGERLTAEDLGPQSVEGFDDVLHLLPQVLLGGWQMQGAVHLLAHLFFGQRVALDGGGRARALGQEDLVQVLGGLGLKRNTGEVLAFRAGFTEQNPDGRRKPLCIQAEGQPGVACLVLSTSLHDILSTIISCRYNKLDVNKDDRVSEMMSTDWHGADFEARSFSLFHNNTNLLQVTLSAK